LLCIAVTALLASCAGFHLRYPADTDVAALLARPAPLYPAARFAVLSDAHLYDTALGATGAAFQEYLDNDRKLLRESREILDAALSRVAGMGVDFLLIAGDLTKDGEKQDHQLMARELAGLRQKGIRTFVVPGNHDILNPRAMSFSESGTQRVPNVTPAEFAEIYNDFGYGEALSRDPGSLSYVAEPVPGLWLLAVDAANYGENARNGSPTTGGGLTQERVDWIEGVLRRALTLGKAVIILEHHGVLEHFPGQAKQSPEYLVNGWQQVSRMYAAYHARVAFTGHFHAQDVTLARTPGGHFLYDVETGSLVSIPNPVRSVEITASQRMIVHSSFITELPSFAARGEDFRTWSKDSVANGISVVAIRTMRGLGVSTEEASSLAPQIADAFIAHFEGDEKFTGTEMLRTKGLSLAAGIVVGARRDLVTGLWHDLEPADNDLSIDLATGEWSAAR
jgi:hypothetical protein